MFQQDTPTYVESSRDYFRAYYEKNKEEKKAASRAYYHANRERIRAAKKVQEPKKLNRGIEANGKEEYNRIYYAEVQAEENLRLKIASLQKVSGKIKPDCEECGNSDIRCLTINHKNGGGRLENMTLKPQQMRKKILSGDRKTDDLNVLCMNCNFIYEYVRGRARLPRDWENVVKEMTNVPE